MADEPLGRDATVVAATEIQATVPTVSGETPYTVVIAEFEAGVRLTGQLCGADAVEPGGPVELGEAVRDRESEGMAVAVTRAVMRGTVTTTTSTTRSPSPGLSLGGVGFGPSGRSPVAPARSVGAGLRCPALR